MKLLKIKVQAPFSCRFQIASCRGGNTNGYNLILKLTGLVCFYQNRQQRNNKSQTFTVRFLHTRRIATHRYLVGKTPFLFLGSTLRGSVIHLSTYLLLYCPSCPFPCSFVHIKVCPRSLSCVFHAPCPLCPREVHICEK